MELLTNPVPKPLAPELCDAHARAFFNKTATKIRFLIESPMGEKAIALGDVIDIGDKNGKRLWKVSLISALPTGSVNTQLPESGSVFVVEDKHLAA